MIQALLNRVYQNVNLIKCSISYIENTGTFINPTYRSTL